MQYSSQTPRDSSSQLYQITDVFVFAVDNSSIAKDIMCAVLVLSVCSSRCSFTRALLCLWISYRLLGGGGETFERPPPMISAPGDRRREKRKAAFESSRKIILKSIRSFFGSAQN